MNWFQSISVDAVIELGFGWFRFCVLTTFVTHILAYSWVAVATVGQWFSFQLYKLCLFRCFRRDIIELLLHTPSTDKRLRFFFLMFVWLVVNVWF